MLILTVVIDWINAEAVHVRDAVARRERKREDCN